MELKRLATHVYELIVYWFSIIFVQDIAFPYMNTFKYLKKVDHNP